TSARRSASGSLGVSAIGVLLLIGAARWRGHGLHDRRRWARSWRDARDEARGVGRIHAELHQQDLAHGALHLAVREALDNRDGLADLRAVEPLGLLGCRLGRLLGLRRRLLGGAVRGLLGLRLGLERAALLVDGLEVALRLLLGHAG